jgi:dCMP deaminase
MSNRARPSWDDYYMNIAWVVSSRSNCLRRAVGALIVVDKRIISTGYNGTPFGVRNCNEGGCPRCTSDSPRHEGYDWCFCVHAEQNAVSLAARQGSATDRSNLYVTIRPCFNCLKQSVQAGIREIIYDQPFDYNEELEGDYQTLLTESDIIMRQHPYSTMYSLRSQAIFASQGTGPEMPNEY